MKENYLEIIKQNEPKEVWDQEDGDFYLLFVPEMWDKVIDAANKMEAECFATNYMFEQLTISLQLKNEVLVKNTEYIKFLEAELALKPDVVFCSECQIVRGVEDDWVWCGLKCHGDRIKNPHKEFCSRGVRKENEK